MSASPGRIARRRVVAGSRAGGCCGFRLANGLVSLVGNLVLMRLLVGVLGMKSLYCECGQRSLCARLLNFAAERVVCLSAVESVG